MRSNARIILGILTAIILLAAIPTYDLYIKDKIDSVEVVVVKVGEEIKPNEVITKGKLGIERRRKEDLIDNVVTAKQMNEIIGYDAAELMISNSMVSTKMVDFDQVIPNPEKDEAIRPITRDMIYAQPGSLRRKDNIDIYMISRSSRQSDSEEVQNVVSSSRSKDSKDSSNENIGIKEPLLTNVKVVYVKDSANQEVINSTENPAVRDERLNASGNISDLEVILNEEDFQLLMDRIIEHNELIYITYN